MYADQIKEHFVRFLGSDVGVSFKDPDPPNEVILYRHDRLPDKFVLLAFQELQRTAPRVAAKIDKLIVSYESSLGRTQRGVDLAITDREHRLPDTERSSQTNVSRAG